MQRAHRRQCARVWMPVFLSLCTYIGLWARLQAHLSGCYVGVLVRRVWVRLCVFVCTWVSMSRRMFIPLFLQPLSSAARSQARYWTGVVEDSVPISSHP